MARLLFLLALCACDAGRPATPPVPAPPPPSTPPRHVTRTETIRVRDAKLPMRGIAVQTTGIGGYVSWDIVDYTTRELVVTVSDSGTSRDQTIALPPPVITELQQLAEKAWRETPHGDVPHALDIMQALYITDHDDAFELHGEPIGDVTGHTGRPDASALVLAIQKLEPPPSRHPHAIPRSDLGLPDLELAAKDLPTHGVVFKSWGLGGDLTLVIDRDASTVRQISNLMGQKHADRTRKLDAAKLDPVMIAATAAWAETPNGEMPTATDVREDLYVFDDDEAFYLSGHPIGANGTKGRPLAAAALNALAPLAR